MIANPAEGQRQGRAVPGFPVCCHAVENAGVEIAPRSLLPTNPWTERLRFYIKAAWLFFVRVGFGQGALRSGLQFSGWQAGRPCRHPGWIFFKPGENQAGYTDRLGLVLQP